MHQMPCLQTWHARPLVLPSLLTALFVLGAAEVRAENPRLEIHELSVWVAEPQLPSLNDKSRFRSAFPGIVDSDRAQRDGDKAAPAPFSLLTIYGDPLEGVDVSLRIVSGRAVAHWPRTDRKGSQLRWLDYKASKEPAGKVQLARVPDSHWFHQARQLDTLYLTPKKGGRSERFLAYDVELKSELAVRVEGGPDGYRIVNGSRQALQDVALVVSTPQGRRIGWLDTLGPATGLPAAPTTAEGAPQSLTSKLLSMFGKGKAAPAAVATPAAVAAPGAVEVKVEAVAEESADAPAEESAPAEEAAPAIPPGVPKPQTKAKPVKEPLKETEAAVELSVPYAAGSSELKDATVGELRRRLSAAGPNDKELDLLLSQYARHLFESDEMLLFFRWPQAAIDETLPLTIEPDTAKVRRVALIIARKIDPELRTSASRLIAELGSASYKEREAAEKRLTELGRQAIPVLTEAVKHKDPEIASRAERILLTLQPPTAEPQE